MILFNQDNISVTYDPATDSIIWKPVGSPKKETFTQSFITGINYLLANYSDTINWINDTSEFDGCKGEMTDWIVENVNPKLYKLDREIKVAFVEPESQRGLASIHIYIAETNLDPNSSIDCKVFKTLNDAVNWIQE